MTDLQIIMEASKSNITKVLTLDAVNQLIKDGKKIMTIYFGYAGQNGTDVFTPGSIITEEQYIHSFNPTWINNYDSKSWYNPANQYHLITTDGRATCIRLHPENAEYNNNAFSCSDVDRLVYYIEINQ